MNVSPSSPSPSEIWYTDVRGKRDREYISLGSDNVVISGRTVLTIYRDFQQSFANTFAEYFKAGIISQVQVGAGYVVVVVMMMVMS